MRTFFTYIEERYLRPLIENEMVSCYVMTEAQGWSNPAEFTATAHWDGDEWVINEEKWFGSNTRFASLGSGIKQAVVEGVADQGSPLLIGARHVACDRFEYS